MGRPVDPLAPGEHGRAWRIWSVIWLPLLLVVLVVALTPVVDEFVLSLVVLGVALAAAGRPGH